MRFHIFKIFTNKDKPEKIINTVILANAEKKLNILASVADKYITAHRKQPTPMTAIVIKMVRPHHNC
ncbi:hypothetical protein DaDZ19_28500 [Dickeya ananatis]